MTAISRLAPWRAQPLHEAAKNAKFRQVMDLRAESVLLGRSAILSGWAVFCTGIGILGASMVGWIIVLNKPIDPPKFLAVDRTTGIIAEPVSIKDAPTLFGEATDHHYLKDYILACEQWVPAMEAQNWHKCMLMSSPEQQARYTAWRAKASSPAKALGRNGYIQIENFRYHQQAGDKATLTRRYLVQFDRTVWRGSDKDQTKTWTANIDFQWMPALPMRPTDRDTNPGGFQAIAYSASPDTPDPTELPK